jgi:hypothetical protein
MPNGFLIPSSVTLSDGFQQDADIHGNLNDTLIKSRVKPISNAGVAMMNVTEFRRINFRRMVEEMGGPLETALKLDMSSSQVSQLISDRIQKNMGAKLARKIEQRAGLAPGSLDLAAAISGARMIPIPVISALDLRNEEPLWQPRASVTGPRKEVIYDRSNPYQPRGPLVAFYLPDNAMDGMAHQGDLMIFDCWPAAEEVQEEVDVGSVVLFRHNDQLAVRRVKQSTAGGFEFIATSDLYAPIAKDDLAAVLGVMIEVRWLKPRMG